MLDFDKAMASVMGAMGGESGGGAVPLRRLSLLQQPAVTQRRAGRQLPQLLPQAARPQRRHGWRIRARMGRRLS